MIVIIDVPEKVVQAIYPAETLKLFTDKSSHEMVEGLFKSALSISLSDAYSTPACDKDNIIKNYANELTNSISGYTQTMERLMNTMKRLDEDFKW